MLGNLVESIDISFSICSKLNCGEIHLNLSKIRNVWRIQ